MECRKSTLRIRILNLARLLLIPRSTHAEQESGPMHILSLRFAVQAGSAVWYRRFKLLSCASSDIADSVGGARSRMRRNAFRKKAESSLLGTTDHSAFAACVLFHRLADEIPKGCLIARERILASSGLAFSRLVAPLLVLSASGRVPPPLRFIPTKTRTALVRN